MKLPIKHFSKNDLRKEADAFDTRFNTSKTIPVPIDLIAEKKLDINIVPLLNLRENLNNDGFISADFSTIHIDHYVYFNIETRYRFSIAHELGHFWLHKKIFEQFDFHTLDEWKKIYLDIDTDDCGWLEYQAYTFAGMVLVPDYALEPQFSLILKNLEGNINKLKDEGIEKESYLEHVINNIALKIAPIFNVSASCMIKRISHDYKYSSII